MGDPLAYQPLVHYLRHGKRKKRPVHYAWARSDEVTLCKLVDTPASTRYESDWEWFKPPAPLFPEAVTIYVCFYCRLALWKAGMDAL